MIKKLLTSFLVSAILISGFEKPIESYEVTI